MPAVGSAAGCKRWFWRSAPIFVLAGGLLLTGLTASMVQVREKEVAQAAFQMRAREIVVGLARRMANHEQILRGVASLFAVNSEVSREEFHRYFEGLRLSEIYPGIQGIGYSVVVPAREKERHIADMRLHGFPNYDIRPAGERDWYTAVVYVEPFDWRNQRALGFDMSLEPIRMQAALLARDSGRVTASDKVTLVQETHENVQAGCIIFLPVYRQGMSAMTVEERRGALTGWVYMPFRIADFVEGYLQQYYPELSRQISLSIFSGTHARPEAVLYQTEIDPTQPIDQSYEVVQTIDMAGRTWLIAMAPQPRYLERTPVTKSPVMILLIGAGLTLLLTAVSHSMIKSHSRVTAALEETTHANQKLAAQEEKIRYLAHHDYLTGLPNRALFVESAMQSLTMAKRYQRRMAILFIDLDNFKRINDQYGHDAGDVVLCAVAKKLQTLIRASDTVCRQGGDEFVVLLSEITDREGVETLAVKLRKAIETPCKLGDHVFAVSASVGIAVYPEHGDTVEAILQRADAAMYRAKSESERHICFA